MLLFITALYAEAKPLIQTLQLTRDPSDARLTLFSSAQARVLVTGSGTVAAVSAVSRFLALYPPADEDLLINIGIAGCDLTLCPETLVGSLFLLTKLTNASTGLTFYPDCLFGHPFAKAEAVTLSRPFSAKSSCFAEPCMLPSSSLLPCLYEMEAAALYQAAIPYLTTERIFFFKVISDDVSQTASADVIHPDALLEPHIPSVLRFLFQIAETISAEKTPLSDPSGTEQSLLSRLSEQLPLTAAMQQELTQSLTYARLGGCNLSSVLEHFLQQLPADPIHGKKQAMPYLNRLREALVASTPFPFRGRKPRNDSYRPPFHTVYVEDGVSKENIPASLLAGSRDVIPVSHYKDIFNRSRQNFSRQKTAPALILARQTGTLLYPGAPVCQSFGNRHFYYTSTVMNCIYRCDYCYLQGMYPSGHIVVFVNLPDYFRQVAKLLTKHPLYLCISYDTDLLALEPLLHQTEEWLRFARSNKDLTLEIRTKSGNTSLFSHWRDYAGSNVIFSWTLSPEEIAGQAEAGAASLSLRLAAARAAKDAGFSIRFCFDPMIYVAQWRSLYAGLLTTVFQSFSAEELFDVSIGVFRISTDYLKSMRKRCPDTPIAWYPYCSENSVSHYGALSEQMVQYLKKLLSRYLPEDKIFVWDGTQANTQSQEEVL